MVGHILRFDWMASSGTGSGGAERMPSSSFENRSGQAPSDFSDVTDLDLSALFVRVEAFEDNVKHW